MDGMSNQLNRAIVLIDVLYLCTDTMIKVNAFARVDLRADLCAAQEALVMAEQKWPGFKNKKWIMDRGKQFRVFADTVPAWEFGTPTLVAMCERMVADLDENARTPLKRELISPLVPIFKRLHDYVDKEGRNFIAYDSSDKLLNELYKIIGWKD